MNWFFHKIYWGGWIAMHNRNKKKLLSERERIGNFQPEIDVGIRAARFRVALPRRF